MSNGVLQLSQTHCIQIAYEVVLYPLYLNCISGCTWIVDNDPLFYIAYYHAHNRTKDIVSGVDMSVVYIIFFPGFVEFQTIENKYR